LRFSAVAFDLDGTLYPDFRLFVRLIPFFLTQNRLLMAMGKARKQLRNARDNSGGNFYDRQARIMAKVLRQPFEKTLERTERLIYRGWERHFKKIRLFPHVKETLDAFRKAGIKMGLLSDFPPETKLEYLGIDGYWSTVVCSEACGHLKPDPVSFLELASRMELPPEQLLYVGNSVRYDVKGAGRVGMKTALVQTGLKRLGRVRPGARPKTVRPGPDFVFNDYRQLCEYVLR
jgi:putative hydrolase of the HAD superfamily